jgi:Na+/serine symporter
MSLVGQLNTVQAVMIGVPLALLWLLLITRMESNGKRQPWVGLLFGPLFIGLIVLLSPALMVSLVKEGIKERRPWQVVIAILLFLVLGGYVAAIIALRSPPPPSPHDLPVER